MASSEVVEGVSIRELAEKHRVPRRTMFYRLKAMHREDQEAAEDCGLMFAPWLFRYAHGKWRVNVTRLLAAHPEIFSASVSPGFDEALRKLERRVARLEKTAKFWQDLATSGNARTPCR